MTKHTTNKCVCEKKHSSWHEEVWENEPSQLQIRERPVSAAGLQGKRLSRKECFFTDTGMIHICWAHVNSTLCGVIGMPCLVLNPGRNRFGSVRFGKCFFPVRRGSACVFRTRRGSVRFGAVRFRVRFRPVPEWFGSVWPVRLVFLFLPEVYLGQFWTSQSQIRSWRFTPWNSFGR